MLYARIYWARWFSECAFLVESDGDAQFRMRTIKEEEVDLSEYTTYADAMKQLGRFLDEVYMQKRIPSSLGYLTPAEFKNQWKQEQPPQSDFHSQ